MPPNTLPSEGNANELPSAEPIYTHTTQRDFPNPWDVHHSLEISTAQTVALPAALHPAPARDVSQSTRTRRPLFVKLLLLIGLSAAPIVSGALTFGALAYDHVFDWQLVRSTAGQTTYLRPQHWEQVSSGQLRGYGNMLGADNKSTATVLASTAPNALPGMYETVSSQAGAMRSMLREAVMQDNMADSIKDGLDCSGVQDIAYHDNSKTTASSIGLMTLSATCQRADGNMNVEYSFIIGKDDHMRAIIVAAADYNWQKNKVVYTKIRESLDQVSTSQIAKNSQSSTGDVLGARYVNATILQDQMSELVHSPGS